MRFPCYDFSLRRVAVLFSVTLGVVLSFAHILPRGLNARLELTELWATELPDSVGIGGAFPGPDGSVTVWTQTNPFLFLFDETGTLQKVTSPNGYRGRNLVPTSAGSPRTPWRAPQVDPPERSKAIVEAGRG